MSHGAGCLVRCKAKTGKYREHTGPSPDYKEYIFAWLISGSMCTFDCSCISYGLQMLHTIRHGAGSLVRCRAKTGKDGENTGPNADYK